MHDNPIGRPAGHQSDSLRGLLGGAARKLGQPRVLGDFWSGWPGPTWWTSCTGGADRRHLAGTIKELAELGVLILMFNIALEIQPRELMAVGKTALYAGVLGAAVPLGVIALLTWAFGFPTHVALLTGVVMSANSTSISAQTLLELGVLRTRRATPCWRCARGRHPGHHARLHLGRADGRYRGDDWLGIGWVVLGCPSSPRPDSWRGRSARVMNWIHITPEFGQLTGVACSHNCSPVPRMERRDAGRWRPSAARFLAALASAGSTRERNTVEQASAYVSYPSWCPSSCEHRMVTDFAQLGLTSLPYAAALIVASVLTKVVEGGGGFWRLQPPEALRVGRAISRAVAHHGFDRPGLEASSTTGSSCRRSGNPGVDLVDAAARLDSLRGVPDDGRKRRRLEPEPARAAGSQEKAHGEAVVLITTRETLARRGLAEGRRSRRDRAEPRVSHAEERPGSSSFRTS
jgi:hypothetical protein